MRIVRYLPTGLDSEMTDRLFERLRTGPREDPLLARLTNQERTIVQHTAEGMTKRQIAEGMTNRQIAERMPCP